MKFYVNEIKQNLRSLKELPHGENYVGLFSQCKTKAEGNFCGYYSSEKYLDADLHAYRIYKNGFLLGDKVSDIKKANIHFPEIQIATHLWTQVIEADTIEEALIKFNNEDWRQWSCDTDEIDNSEKTL